MLRLVHFSDIHVSAGKLDWQRPDWFTRRVAGWINHRWLGRRYRFRHGEDILAVMAAEFDERKPDHIVFSGDATALGFEAELRRAAELLQLIGEPKFPGIAVPGNHDHCVESAAESGLFERYFAAWQQGLRVDNETYPFAQRVGHVWLVGVNSSTPNLWPWDARGRVGEDQLDRLRWLLDQLDDAPRILVTHYPFARRNGRPESWVRMLRDADKLGEVAAAGGVCLWLHGHCHRAFVLSDAAPFPIVCAGSATQTRHWGYAEYCLNGLDLHIQRRVFDFENRRFQDVDSYDLVLPTASTANQKS